jgi:hypothetical protein
MKTLHEIQEIEKYLDGRLNTPSKMVFEARLLIDPVLRFSVECQRKLHSIVRLSGRRKIKVEADRIHHQLFSNPAKQAFQHSVFQFFSKNK